MKLPVKLAIGFTAAIVIFTSGYFLGKSSGREILITQSAAQSVIADSGAALPVSSGETAAQESYGKININTATAEELSALQGIGETLSVRIIEYREEHGDFSSIEEIMKVNGIGENKFLSIKDYITIGG